MAALSVVFKILLRLRYTALYCNTVLQDKETATSLEFAYATMLDVSCIISSGSHDQCLVSHALSDVHHMMQVRCDQIKGEYCVYIPYRLMNCMAYNSGRGKLCESDIICQYLPSKILVKFFDVDIYKNYVVTYFHGSVEVQ